jgi:hypothetical protein
VRDRLEKVEVETTRRRLMQPFRGRYAGYVRRTINVRRLLSAVDVIGLTDGDSGSGGNMEAGER